ncbi:MAG: thermonuclease family protein [Lawsonibacter sp.]
MEFDVQQRDQYGRLLAYVWVDGKMYNKTLLEDGIANLATYPPQCKICGRVYGYR